MPAAANMAWAASSVEGAQADLLAHVAAAVLGPAGVGGLEVVAPDDDQDRLERRGGQLGDQRADQEVAEQPADRLVIVDDEDQAAQPRIGACVSRDRSRRS
jgi:hypothetical protein